MSETTNTDLNPRTAFRQAVRERAFASALELVQLEGWNQLRISQIAKDIGVSRPTLYTEFGTKEDFGQALLEYETVRVLNEFSSVLEANKKNPERALEKAFAKAIELGQTSPLVPAMLSPLEEPIDGAPAAYRFITEGLLPLVDASSYVLANWAREVCPTAPEEKVTTCTSVMARLTLSHIMTPADKTQKTPKQLAQIALTLLPELDS